MNMSDLTWLPGEVPPFSFCESVWSSGLGTWCIRQTSAAGLKHGGGIDTPSLCGRVPARNGWDLEVRITEHNLGQNACKACVEKYRWLVSQDAPHVEKPK